MRAGIIFVPLDLRMAPAHRFGDRDAGHGVAMARGATHDEDAGNGRHEARSGIPRAEDATTRIIAIRKPLRRVLGGESKRKAPSAILAVRRARTLFQ